jgi:hypothetical protein
MKKLTVVLFLGIMFLFGAGFGRNGKAPSNGPVDFQVILSGAHSNATTNEVKLIKNERQWEDTWRMAMGRQEPLPDKPTVNFDSQYVIAAFMGERSSSGYKIDIDKIEREGKTLRVYVKKFETPGMLTVMTQPFTLVRLPKGNYHLEVIEETVQ